MIAIALQSPFTLGSSGMVLITFLITLILFVVGFIIVYQHKNAKARVALLSSWAAQHGYEFDPSKDRDWAKERHGLRLMKQGSSRHAFNTMRTSIDIDGRSFGVRMGDYTFTVSTGKTTVTYYVSYVSLETPFVLMPQTCIRRENPIDKLSAAMGFDDIDFEDVEFSERFHVSSDDRRFAYDLLDPRMIEHLKHERRDGTRVIEILDGEILLYGGFHASYAVWNPEEFRDALDDVTRFVSHIPCHLIRDLEAGGAP